MRKLFKAIIIQSLIALLACVFWYCITDNWLIPISIIFISLVQTILFVTEYIVIEIEHSRDLQKIYFEHLNKIIENEKTEHKN